MVTSLDRKSNEIRFDVESDFVFTDATYIGTGSIALLFDNNTIN